MYDQTDVHPAAVKHKALLKGIQSTLKRHLLASTQV